MPPRRDGLHTTYERATDDVCALLSKTHEGGEGGEAVRRRVPFKLSSGLAQVICVSGSQLLRRQTKTMNLFWESMWTWH